MSNAMRTGKRALAGVAAGALGLALIPFVSATSANAADISATVSPVRAGTVGTIPAATLAFAKTQATPSSVSVITAPSGTARVTLSALSSGIATPSASDDSAVLGTADSSLASGLFTQTSGDDSIMGISVNEPGSYTIRFGSAGDYITASFTTVGAPASLELAPATQTVLVGANGSLTATLKDASGNVTQPLIVDTIGLSTDTDDTVAATAGSTTALTSLAWNTTPNLSQGTATIYVTTAGNPAGTTTVTAAPQGTLNALGNQTATVVKSGTVSETAIAGISVTSPTNALNAGTFPAKTAKVPAGSTSVTVTIDDTTAAEAGNTIRIGVNTSSGTVNGGAYVNGDDTLYLDLTTDSNKQATTTFTLGGTAPLNGQTLTVQQVSVLDAQVGSVELVVTQETPAITAASVTVSPDDSVIAQLGATTNVQVTVEDQFGTAASGYGVSAYRGTSVPGDLTTGFLSNGTTNASGVATVTVTSATGAAVDAVEQYSFAVFTPAGANIAAADKDNALQITYTENGEVTSLSVTASPALSPTPVTNTTTAVVTAPLINVVSSGTANDIVTSTFTVATGANSGTPDGNYAEFTPTASPLNSVTVTTPEGVFVAADEDTAWDAGSASLTVSSATPVRIFATKVGTFDVTFTSGGKTTIVPVKVVNTANDAYNLAIAPAEQTIAAGAIGTAIVTVTDVFGNPVTTEAPSGTAADDTGVFTVMASGEALLAGFQTAANFGTNASGEATVTFIAGNAAGSATLAVMPLASGPTPAWQEDYTPPTNAPAPVTSTAATITVSGGPSAQSITIVGERGIVRGRPGIIVDGLTEGFGEGAIVRPWVKFPGETSYTEGVRQILVDQDGEFMWQRRTGKKIYIIIKSEDGSVRSNRIIIPAQ